MAKRKLKKLSTNKLEDRIAPAMIGGVLEGAEVASDVGAAVVEAPPEPVEADTGVEPVDEPMPTEAADTAEPVAEAPPADDGLGFDSPTEPPPPDYHLPDDATVAPDGGIDFAPTHGVMDYNYADQTLHLDNDAAEAMMPDYMHMAPDGGVALDMPMGTEFDPDTGTLVVPNAGTDQFIPENVDIGSDSGLPAMITHSRRRVVWIIRYPAMLLLLTVRFICRRILQKISPCPATVVSAVIPALVRAVLATAADSALALIRGIPILTCLIMPNLFQVKV